MDETADEWEISFKWSLHDRVCRLLSDDLALSNICLSTISTYRKKIALYILCSGTFSYGLNFIDSGRKQLHDDKLNFKLFNRLFVR